MKIFTRDAVHIQLNDFTHLGELSDSIPATIFEKVLANDTLLVTDDNRYDFIDFNTPEEIEFFRNLDYIVDYDSVKDLSEEDIIALGQSIAEEMDEVARKYNALNDNEKEKNQSLRVLHERLKYEFFSLRDVLWFKKGHLRMQLPPGVPYPDGYKREKGIKRFVMTMLNRNNRKK